MSKPDPSGSPGRLNDAAFHESFKLGLIRALYCRWCNTCERMTSSSIFYCPKCDTGKPYDWSPDVHA